MKSVVKLSDIPLTAIAKVVDYLENDEEEHYDSSGSRNHIVHSVRRLKKFLYTIDPDTLHPAKSAHPLRRAAAQISKAMGAGKERKRRNGKHEKIRVVALSEARRCV